MEIGAKIATLGHVQNEHAEKKGEERKREKWSRDKKGSEGMRRYEKDCVGLEKQRDYFSNPDCNSSLGGLAGLLVLSP